MNPISIHVENPQFIAESKREKKKKKRKEKKKKKKKEVRWR